MSRPLAPGRAAASRACRLAPRLVLLLGPLRVLCLACLFMVGCSFTGQDRRAIEGVLREQAAAWNHGDLEGFLRAYEPSEALVFTSGGAIRRGYAAARARYLERYGARGAETMGHLEFEIVDVRGLGRDAAVVLGRWRLTQTEAAGAGVFTLVFRRDARGWSIVHDHTSVDKSDPTPAPSADDDVAKTDGHGQSP
ncbi:YybH family protein [Nannocystis pusilla]|uniref:YybH family protein n=1 Tax=Nannocystis pusilla TaxID=889268 RepID=UPI003DA65B50